MKFFCLLFAFYILGISAMPCNDVHEGTKTEISTVTEAQDHHEDHHDICSPFCICSCCQGFVALSSFPEGVIPFLPAAIDLSLLTEKFLPSSLASIWQPPKIS